MAIFASMQPPEALEALDTVVMPDDGRFIDVLGQKLRESEEAGRRKIAFKMSTFDYLWLAGFNHSSSTTCFFGEPA